jgi:type VII secretion-associated serine protease mycosin
VKTTVRAFVVVVALLVSVVVAPAAVAAGCSTPNGVYTGVIPWAQRQMDAPDIWPLTTGTHVTVAVVGTGVDGANAQFAPGQVLPPIDLLPGGGAAPDCDGRGTIAAGIVGAQRSAATTFAGVAPGARILPIRYTETTTGVSSDVSPDALATAISRAVDAHAGVILVVVPATSDSARLRSAVARALSAGDVVVSPAAATSTDGVSYPTATPGVLGVGSVAENGAVPQEDESGKGGYLAVAAPGVNLVSTAPGAGGHLGHVFPVSGAGFAAAFAAGTVALLRSYRPDLTPAQIVNRLTLTASRPPGGGHSDQLGWGVLDPYAAVTSELPADAPGPGARAVLRPAVAVPPAPAPVRAGSPYRWAAVLAVLAVLLAALVVFGAATVRRGRARGWRLGRLRD